MEQVSKILLKNGINGMIREDEEYFKSNIIQSLSFKLNDAINEVSGSVKEKLLVSESETPYDSSLSNLIEFLNTCKYGKYKFKDDTFINITESDLENIKKLFEQLNPQNRIKMAREIFESALIFKQHIEFSKSVKGLL